MAKQPKKELTLRLEPSDKFVRGDDFAHAFAVFLKATKSLSADSTKVEWVISELKVGSSIIGLEPIGDDDAGARAVHLGSAALKALESGDALPTGVPDDFLDGVRELGELAAKRKIRASIANGAGRVVISRKVIDLVEEFREVASTEEFGSVEGRLDGINIHNTFQCHVYTDAEKVAVEFEKDQLENVKAALGSRVSVRGTITFSKQGRPMRVDEAKVHRFPSDDELPSIDDMMGIAPEITGGMPADQYIRTLRESDGE